MASCPQAGNCAFYRAVEPSLVKRIRYATSFPYCNSGKHESCALHPFLVAGSTPPADLLPNGGLADYADELPEQGSGMRVVVLDDSPVFSLFAANAVATCLPGASIVRCDSYSTAAGHLREADCGLIVCGYGVGDGRTAHDVRRITSAPMVLLTGRPEAEIDMPSDARVVAKGAGPDALRAAIGAAVRV